MPFDSIETNIKSSYTPFIQWNTLGVTSPIGKKSNIELFNYKNKNNNNDSLVIEHGHNKKSEQTEQTKTNTLQERIIKIEQELKKAENSNGLLGKAWSWFKNKTDGFLPVDSSNNVRKQLEIEKEKIKDIQKPEVFEELTGVEYSDENYTKFENGEIKLLSEQKLEGYKEGQDMVVDVVADIGAGIIAGIALAVAPVTGGASLLLAAGVGGVTKLGIKATSAGIRGKDYSSKDVLKDLGTGAITGLLTPVTMGVGGAVGNVSTRIGARIFGQSAVGKIATKATTFVLKEGSIGAVFGGGAEGLGEVGRQGYHAVTDGDDFDFGKIYDKTKEGTIGGAVAGILMSSGMKGLSKGTEYSHMKFLKCTNSTKYSKYIMKKAQKHVNDYNKGLYNYILNNRNLANDNIILENIENILKPECTNIGELKANINMREMLLTKYLNATENKEKYHEVIKLLSKRIPLFEHFDKEISLLTQTQKREYLNFIIKNKYELGRFTNDSAQLLNDVTGIKIPLGEDFYVSTIKELSKQLKSPSKLLHPQYIERFSNIIEKLADTKNTNFVSNYLNELMKFNMHNSSDNISLIKQIVSKKEFKMFSEQDRKILILSALLQKTKNSTYNATDNALDAYLFIKNLKFNENEARKIYSIIKSSSDINKFLSIKKTNTKEKQLLLNSIAYDLRESNDFELTKILYSSNHSINLEGFYQILKDRIDKIKSTQIVFPQITKHKLLEKAFRKKIIQKNKTYDLDVIDAKCIDNFYALTHNPEYMHTNNKLLRRNFANFFAFFTPFDQHTICAGNICDGHFLSVGNNGFLLRAKNSNIHIASRFDLHSECGTIQQMLNEFFSKLHIMSKVDNSRNYGAREFLSKEIKTQLFDSNYKKIRKNMYKEIKKINKKYKKLEKQLDSNSTEFSKLKKLKQQEIENLNSYKTIKRIEEQYISMTEKIKTCTENDFSSYEDIAKIDANLANIYKRLFNTSKTKNVEFIISEPEIYAIYTRNIDRIPTRFLELATKEHLPIVIIK